jgi:hypothetical protein
MPAPARRAGGARRAGVFAAPKGTVERRRAALLADLEGPAPTVFVSPIKWPEGKLQLEIVTYIRGNPKRTVDGLDQRLQRLYPGVPGMRMLCHHETDSRKTRAGWPDLFIAGPGGQAVAELKTEARRDQATPEQELWLEVLTYGGAAAYLWTPRDWLEGAIQRELERLARPLARPASARPPAPPTWPCGCLIGRPHTCETWGGLSP